MESLELTTILTVVITIPFSRTMKLGEISRSWAFTETFNDDLIRSL